MKSIFIQGIAYDEKSSFQRGPRLAPPIIREALHSGSLNLYAENGMNTVDPRVVDKGDFKIKDYFDIEEITGRHLQNGTKILTLGGDHSISFPVLKAYQRVYPKIDILHIDAHADLYDHYENDPYSHACPFARIMENKLSVRLVQVGIRTLNPHQKAQAKKFDVEIHQMKDYDPTAIRDFENPVYISLDMDGFDPAFAPGVSHHEPGGLSSRQVIELIRKIKVPVIGADIVEYNPNRDFQQMTAFLAAKIMKELLGKMMES